jgi:hypothetical protein
LVVRSATCAECNNGISKKFEQNIAGRLLHFRRILSLKDRRGEIPAVEITVQLDGQERRASLMGDGSTVLRPRVIEVVRDGVAETIYENLPEPAKEGLRKKAKEKGLQVIEEPTPGGTVEASMAGQLDFLISEEMLRYVAKIAYTALALRMGIAVAQFNSFRQIRDYITSGQGKSPVRLFLNEAFLAGSQQGFHQHSVVLAGRNDRGRVDAIGRLFGGLCYLVNLSDSYQGADFFDTLVYDSQRGEINKVLATHVQSEILQIETLRSDENTVWDDQERAGEWFVAFVDKEINRSVSE